MVDNATLHKAKQVQPWWAAPPRFAGLYVPPSCPQANPLERACGDVHAKGTRTHPRKRMGHLVQEVQPHLRVKGPWPYALAEISYTPEVTTEGAVRQAVSSSPAELSQLAA